MYVKVHTFWEDYKISNVDLSYVSSASQIYGGDFAKFSEYMNFTY